jgi:hypothetical protein
MLPLLARLGPELSPILWGAGQGKMSMGSILAAGTAWVHLAAFVGLSVGALVQAFRTFSPRLPNAPASLAFFGDIARLSREEYCGKVCAISHDDALKNMIFYNHNLSKICVEKFAQLRRAIKLFQGAFACWLVLLLLIGSRELI